MYGARYYSGMAEWQPVDADEGAASMRHYELTLRGRLDPSWSDWFDGLEVRPTADGHTVLSGPLPDQAALHGVLARIRDGDRAARAQAVGRV